MPCRRLNSTLNQRSLSHLTFQAPYMPRRPRILPPDHPLHIVQRAIRSEPCQFAEVDYRCSRHGPGEAARPGG